MNWIDIGILVLATGGVILGCYSGLLQQVGRIVNLIASTYITLYFHESLAVHLVQADVAGGIEAGIISFMMTFLASYVLLNLVLYIIQVVTEATPLRFIDRVLGGVIGLVKGVFIAGILLMGIAMYPNPEVSRDIHHSVGGEMLLTTVERSVILVPDHLTDRLHETYQLMKREGEEQLKYLTKNELEDMWPSWVEDADDADDANDAGEADKETTESGGRDGSGPGTSGNGTSGDNTSGEGDQNKSNGTGGE